MTGLEWVTQYDILAVLTMSNIFPSDVKTYDIKSIFQAVNDAFGVDPAIDCIYDKVICQHILIVDWMVHYLTKYAYVIY